MRLRHIEIFQALMQTHSVTRAAQQLRTSQPTASRFLADLEREIGFKLFDRAGGKLTPTPEAEALYAEVQRSFSGLDRIAETAAGIAEFRADRLRIASISSFALGVLAKLLPSFQRRYSAVDLSLFVGTFDEVVRSVVANQCEIGFVAYPVDHSGILQRPLLDATSVCAMPAGHRLEAKGTIRIEDLRDENFIALGRTVPSGQHIEQIFEQAGVTQNTVIETQTAAIACSLVKQGMGISVLDPLTVGALLDSQMRVRPFVPGFNFRFSALTRRGRPVPLIARRFFDEVLLACEEAAKAHAGTMAP